MAAELPKLINHEGHEVHEENRRAKSSSCNLNASYEEIHLNPHSIRTIDYDIGNIFVFPLRVLRALRGKTLNSLCNDASKVVLATPFSKTSYFL
jgi:hypothetical protein